MTDNWRDFEPGRSGLSVAQLENEQEALFQIVDNPYRESTEESENALHVPVCPLEVPDDMVDMSGESVQTGENEQGEPHEYNIINSSSAFNVPFIEAFESENVVGQHVRVTAYQEGDDVFSRTYEVDTE